SMRCSGIRCWPPIIAASLIGMRAENVLEVHAEISRCRQCARGRAGFVIGGDRARWPTAADDRLRSRCADGLPEPLSVGPEGDLPDPCAHGSCRRTRTTFLLDIL